MKTLLLFLSFVLFNNLNSIHEDTPLTIDSKGNIVGLPNGYGVAKFDSKTKTLRINKKQIVFPKCMSHYFEVSSNQKMILSASWYHYPILMPYYISFEIAENDSYAGQKILLNLNTLELISIYQSVSTKGGGLYYKAIILDKNCSRDYQNAISTLH